MSRDLSEPLFLCLPNEDNKTCCIRFLQFKKEGLHRRFLAQFRAWIGIRRTLFLPLAHQCPLCQENWHFFLWNIFQHTSPPHLISVSVYIDHWQLQIRVYWKDIGVCHKISWWETEPGLIGAWNQELGPNGPLFSYTFASLSASACQVASPLYACGRNGHANLDSTWPFDLWELEESSFQPSIPGRSFYLPTYSQVSHSTRDDTQGQILSFHRGNPQEGSMG